MHSTYSNCIICIPAKKHAITLAPRALVILINMCLKFNKMICDLFFSFWDCFSPIFHTELSTDRFQLLCVDECVHGEKEVKYFTLLIREQCPRYTQLYIVSMASDLGIENSRKRERHGYMVKSVRKILREWKHVCVKCDCMRLQDLWATADANIAKIWNVKPFLKYNIVSSFSNFLQNVIFSDCDDCKQ